MPILQDEIVRLQANEAALVKLVKDRDATIASLQAQLAGAPNAADVAVASQQLDAINVADEAAIAAETPAGPITSGTPPVSAPTT